MPTKPKLPVESYDPRLLVLLEKGCKQEVKLSCGTRENAIHTRHQIHSFRHALKTNKRTDWEQLYAAGVYIDPTDPTTVVVRPRSAGMTKILDAAGIPNLSEPPPPALDTDGATSISIDQFLADLHKLK